MQISQSLVWLFTDQFSITQHRKLT